MRLETLTYIMELSGLLVLNREQLNTGTCECISQNIGLICELADRETEPYMISRSTNVLYRERMFV